jgi:hypothetical protein
MFRSRDYTNFTVSKIRNRIGMFDPPSSVPYNQISASENDTAVHAESALKMAIESMVLLKNYGTPSHPTTILQGITNLTDTNIIAIIRRCWRTRCKRCNARTAATG